MQSFPIPNYNFKFKKFNKEHLEKNRSLFDSIPIHSINLLLPTSERFDSDYEDILIGSDNTYFILHNLSVSSLVEETFLENFMKKGSLCGLSLNSENNKGNFISLTLSGKLVLKLENNIASYLSLLKTKPSFLNHKRTGTHEVCILDLNSSDYKAGKKIFESIVFELKKIDYVKFDFLLKWNPGENICCESLRQYFESQNIECLACEPSHKQRTTSHYIPIPEINFENMRPDLIENYVEWIGAHICNVNYIDEEDDTDEFVSKFFMPKSSEKRKLHIGTCQGFYISNEIYGALKRVRNYFKKDTKMPFAALLFNGYQTCYIDSKDSGKVSSADKVICVIVSPELDYWLISLNL